jgi:hypothetical protein
LKRKFDGIGYASHNVTLADSNQILEIRIICHWNQVETVEL